MQQSLKSRSDLWLNYLSEGIAFKWINIMMLDDETHTYLGISEEGIWVVGSNRGLRKLDSIYNGFFGLPMLKYDRIEFILKLKNAILNLGIPLVIIKTFPFDQIVQAGIGEGGRYIEPILNWIDGGYPMSDTIANALLEKNLNVSCVKKYEEKRLEEILGEKI